MNRRPDLDQVGAAEVLSGTASVTDPTDKALRDLLEVVDLAEPMRRRAVQQAINEATAVHWERRAAMFEWAAPRPDDYPGTAPRPSEALDVALACRRHAQLIRGWNR